MGDAKKNVREGASHSQGLNPPPDVPIWDSNSLSHRLLWKSSLENILH